MEVKQQEMALDQQRMEQLMALQQQSAQQKAALEQQSMQLTMEYQQKKAEEEMQKQQFEMEKKQQEMQMKMGPNIVASLNFLSLCCALSVFLCFCTHFLLSANSFSEFKAFLSSLLLDFLAV